VLEIVRSNFFLVPSVSSTIALEDSPRKASCTERPDLSSLSDEEVLFQRKDLQLNLKLKLFVIKSF
jgi:hypothetical protein